MKSIEALYAAHPIPDDPALAAGLQRIAENAAALVTPPSGASADSLTIASDYLTANLRGSRTA